MEWYCCISGVVGSVIERPLEVETRTIIAGSGGFGNWSVRVSGKTPAIHNRTGAGTLYCLTSMQRNREIEVKLSVRDLPAIVRRLEGLGARRVARVFEQNALFDTPGEHFKRHESILRIRVEENAGLEGKPRRHKRRKTGGEGLLTFKCPAEGSRKGRRIAQSRYKEREEIEYRLPDAGRFAQLLQRLGLRVWFRYEKYRTHYRISGSTLKIDLDETPIGTFLELEGSRRSIDRAAEALGYSVRDYNSASYFELYAIECGRRGIPVANMAFSSKKNANSRTLRLTKFASAFNK